MLHDTTGIMQSFHLDFVLSDQEIRLSRVDVLRSSNYSESTNRMQIDMQRPTLKRLLGPWYWYMAGGWGD